MDVGIIGDYNSFMTGEDAIKIIWDKTFSQDGSIITNKKDDPIGWERLLAEKFEFINLNTSCHLLHPHHRLLKVLFLDH